MGTPLGPKYIPYTYMDPLSRSSLQVRENYPTRGNALEEEIPFSWGLYLLDPPRGLSIASHCNSERQPRNRDSRTLRPIAGPPLQLWESCGGVVPSSFT